MIAELKNITSLEKCSLEDYYPDNYECFELTLTLTIGPKGEDSADFFEVSVCSPKWIEGICSSGSIFMSRHTLVIEYYNFKKIQSHIEGLCRNCQGKTWDEVARKISRYARWQFEDYQALD